MKYFLLLLVLLYLALLMAIARGAELSLETVLACLLALSVSIITTALALLRRRFPS